MAYIEKAKKAPRRVNQHRRAERQQVYQSALWRKLRTQKLMETPLCEVCMMQGRLTAGDHVHHLRSFVDIRDKAERDLVAYDPDNLMTVCEACHGRIHGGDLKGCRSAEDIRKKLKL